MCARILQALEQTEREAREAVAQWMTANHFATGHGETIQDLLTELRWQIVERENLLEKRFAAAIEARDKEHADHLLRVNSGWNKTIEAALKGLKP
jgi:hypothetical protein